MDCTGVGACTEVAVRIRSVICSALAAALATALAVAVSTGCFTYVGVDPGAIVPGRDISIQLTDAGTAGLAALIGPGMVAMDGRVVTVDTVGLGLAVTQTTDRHSIDHLWRGELVIVPRPFVDRIRQRKLSPTRTALLGVGILAAAIAAGVAVHSSTQSTSSGHGGGGGN
jgi:hypothetical protein